MEKRRAMQRTGRGRPLPNRNMTIRTMPRTPKGQILSSTHLYGTGIQFGINYQGHELHCIPIGLTVTEVDLAPVTSTQGGVGEGVRYKRKTPMGV